MLLHPSWQVEHLPLNRMLQCYGPDIFLIVQFDVHYGSRSAAAKHIHQVGSRQGGRG